MAAQKQKKIVSKKFCAFLNVYCPKTPQINLSTLLILPDQMEDC